MRHCRRFCFGLLLLCAVGFAQQNQPQSAAQPDCTRFFTLGAIGTTTAIDNHPAGCDLWVLTYSVNGFSAMSLVVESSLDGAGGTTPAAFGNFAGTVTKGTNPNTIVNGTQITTQLDGYYPWVRMNLASKTGSGSVIGVLQGWKLNPNGSAGGSATGGGCVGTIATPCVVVGPGADGAPVVGSPVRVAGKDAAGNTQDIFVDTTGTIVTVRSASGVDGVANTTGGLPIKESGGVAFPFNWPMIFNGSTWDRQFRCPLRANLNWSTTGDAQVIALSGSTSIRICSITFSSVAPEDVKLTQGTGSNCAGSPADVTALYKSVQSFDFEFPFPTTLNGSASQAICINQSVAQASGVTILYAQF